MHVERGFTLIEILVVVMIIGISMGFAMLAFGDFGGSRRAIIAAEQLVSYIKLVQQRAILESTSLGIKFNGQSYQTVRWTNNQWQELSARSIFHPRTFPNNLQVTVHGNNKTKLPDIIINASGDISTFTIDFATQKEGIKISLINQIDHSLFLQYPKSS